MIQDINQAKFSDHFSLQTAAAMQRISRPLQQFNIHHFAVTILRLHG